MKSMIPLKFRGKKERGSTRYPRFGLAELTDRDGWMGEAYVKEVSRDGASFSHSDPAAIPDEVVIYFPSDKVKVNASVKWRSEGMFGVAFATSLDLATDAHPEATDRIRHLGWNR